MEIVFVWGDQERGGEPTGGRERAREGGAAPSGTLKANPLPFAGLQRLVPLKGGIKAAVGEGGVVRRIGGAFSLCSRASWNRSILPCDGAGAGAEVAGGPDGTDGGGAGRHLCTAAGNERGGRHQRQSLALHYDRDRLARRRQLPL